MWGNITIEANLQTNFNVGFTNMKSDVLIHLTQWQYWWWFWFGLLWSFYYLVILRIVRFRSLKFRPRLATSYRPHGKWGDLIVCIIPVSWCANIISNSNFILRMIEWQSEAGLLTVRIRGKQWYWIYKFELKTFTDILTVPKNIGRNKWQISTPGDLQVAEDYLQILQLRSSNRWASELWDDLSKDGYDAKDVQLISPQEQLRFNFFKNFENNLNYEISQENSLSLPSLVDVSFEDLFSENYNDNYKLIDSNFDINFNTRFKNKKSNWGNIEYLVTEYTKLSKEQKKDPNYRDYMVETNLKPFINTFYQNSNSIKKESLPTYWSFFRDSFDSFFLSRNEQTYVKKDILNTITTLQQNNNELGWSALL